MEVPCRKTLTFLLLKFQDFLSFLFILKSSYSKPFHNTLNYTSTANIEEVMKFYNLGDKTFETDLRRLRSEKTFQNLKVKKSAVL